MWRHRVGVAQRRAAAAKIIGKQQHGEINRDAEWRWQQQNEETKMTK